MSLQQKLELFQEFFMGDKPSPFAAGGVTLNKLAQRNDPVTGTSPNKIPDQPTLNASFDLNIPSNDTFFWNTEWFNGDLGGGSSIDIRDGGGDAACQATLDELMQVVTWSKLRRRTQDYPYMPKMGCYFSSFRDTQALFGDKLTDAGWDAKQAAVDRLFVDDSLPARLVSWINHITYLSLSGYFFYGGRGNTEAQEVALWKDMMDEQIMPFHSALKRMGNNGGNTKINLFLWPTSHPGGNHYRRAWSYNIWRGMLDVAWDYYERGIIGAITIWSSELSSTPVTHTDYTPATTNIATYNAITDALIRGRLGPVQGGMARDTAQFSLAGATDMAGVCAMTQNALNSISEFTDVAAWGADPFSVTWVDPVVRVSHALAPQHLPEASRTTLEAPVASGTDLGGAGLFNLASQAITTGTTVTLSFIDQFVTPANTWWDATNDWATEHAGSIIRGGTP